MKFKNIKITQYINKNIFYLIVLNFLMIFTFSSCNITTDNNDNKTNVNIEVNNNDDSTFTTLSGTLMFHLYSCCSLDEKEEVCTTCTDINIILDTDLEYEGETFKEISIAYPYNEDDFYKFDGKKVKVSGILKKNNDILEIVLEKINDGENN